MPTAVASACSSTLPTIDDVWSAGFVGLYRGGSAAQQYDDFKVGLDNNSDLDIDDGGDEVVINDDFSTNVISLSYDNNGNVTDDGINKFAYDAWNRKVKATWRIKSPPSTVLAQQFDGAGRMTQYTISNCGVENVLDDGGNRTTHYLFNGSSVVEERNGSNQVARQYLHGSNGPIWIEVNGDSTIGNDTNPDVTATGEGSESPADKRYVYAAGRSGTPDALTEYGGGNNGRVVERYPSKASRAPFTLKGDSGGGELSSSAAVNIGGLYGGNGGRPPLEIVIGHPGWSCCRNIDTGEITTHYGMGCGEMGPLWDLVNTPASQCSPMGGVANGGPVVGGPAVGGPTPCGPGELRLPNGRCGGGIDTTSVVPPGLSTYLPYNSCPGTTCSTICAAGWYGFTNCNTVTNTPCICLCGQNIRTLCQSPPCGPGESIVTACTLQHERSHERDMRDRNICQRRAAGENPRWGSDECAAQVVDIECTKHSANSCLSAGPEACSCLQMLYQFVRSATCESEVPQTAPCPPSETAACNEARQRAINSILLMMQRVCH